MSNTTPLGIIAALLLILFSCKDSTPSKTGEPSTEFNPHVVAFTSGVIQSNEPLYIELQATRDWSKLLPEKDIKIRPHIEGELTWTGEHTLLFHPAKTWKAGTTYKVDMELDNIKELTSAAPFSFEFHVADNLMSLIHVEVLPEPDDKGETHMIRGQLRGNQPFNTDGIEKSITVRGRSQEDILWNHDIRPHTYEFIIRGIKRQDERQTIEVHFDGQVIGVDAQHSKSLTIPKLKEFSIINHTSTIDQQREILIHFSDDLAPTQETKGLIQIRPLLAHEVVIDGNRIKVIPKKSSTAMHEISVGGQLLSLSGKKLGPSQPLKVKFRSARPQIAQLESGVIVPRSKGLSLPFKSIGIRACKLRVVEIMKQNVPFHLQVNTIEQNNQIKRAGRIIFEDVIPLRTDEAVDFATWNNFNIHLENYIDVEPGALYRIYLGMSPKDAIYDCPDSVSIESENFIRPTTWTEHESYDEWGSYYPMLPQGYNWRDRDNPCKPSYYYDHRRMISQNLFGSELGLLVKKGEDKNVHAYVTDILSAKARSGVTIKAYSYQNVQIGQGTTNADGHVILELDEQAHLITAESDGDHGYLVLKNAAASNLSMFDVEGKRERGGISAWMYGDRGVWRPGDSLYLHSVVRDEMSKLDLGYPLVFEWYDPKGRKVETRVQAYDGRSIYPWHVSTPPDAITGRWRSVLKIGKVRVQRYWSIETVKPNRIKMIYDIDEGPVPLVDNTFKTGFKAEWMHGAPASGLDADVKIHLKPHRTKIKGYEAFQFDHIASEFNPQEQAIFKGKLDAEGRTKLEAKLPNLKPPGMIKAELTSRVYEQGGGFSIDRFSSVLSPYKTYVGIKMSKATGWRNSYESTDEKQATIVLTDPEGRAQDGEVEVIFYQMKWHWWYNEGQQSIQSFMRRSNKTVLRKEKIRLNGGRAFLDLPCGDGKFIMVVQHPDGHSASVDYWCYWDDGDDRESAKMMSLTSDKMKYDVGEEVTIDLPEYDQGSYIISLERGGRLLSSRRVDAASVKGTYRFLAGEDMVPNAYVHITHIQPHAQTANDLPIRTFGVVYVEVESPSTHLEPELITTGDWKPEKTATIQVKENTGQPMEYTIAVVDEGLLQLTRFKSPDPWKAFHQKLALAVRTWDLYDFVMGAHAGHITSLLAMGGDVSITPQEAAKANRFPPVVRHFGPFKLDANASAAHDIDIPNYIGELRVMLVAANDHAYGSASVSKKVTQPLMILPTLPRVLAPKEMVKMPVTVFAMKDNIRKVDVRVRNAAGDGVKVIGSDTRTVQFDRPGDQVVYFDLEVGSTLNLQKIQIEASGHGQTATDEIQILVRSSNPEMREQVYASVAQGETADLNYSPVGILGTQDNALWVQAGFGMDWSAHSRALQYYPHGCLEQTTSKVFPQIFLTEVMPLDQEAQDKIVEHVDGAVQRMIQLQLKNGGLGYWPGADHASPWSTTYALHFLLEAKQRGFSVPESLLAGMTAYQIKVANAWLEKDYGIYRYRYTNQFDQAYRLYTLALAGKPNIGAMNRLRASKQLSLNAKWRLAAAYQLIGRKQDADAIIQVEPFDKETTYTRADRTFGSSLRDKAMILETLVLMERWDDALALGQDIASAYEKQRWHSTHTSGMVLMACSKLAQELDADQLSFEYQLDGGSWQSVKVSDQGHRIKLPATNQGQVRIKNKGEKRIVAQINMSGVPLEGDEKDYNQKLNMKVRYLDLSGQELNISNLRVGDDFIIEVSVQHPGQREAYEYLALTQILPSGWEIHNERLDIGGKKKSGGYTYQDIRDDRVYTYFNLGAEQTKTFRTKITAAYPGDFYMPSVYCEAMYDGDIQAQIGGQWIAVNR